MRSVPSQEMSMPPLKERYMLKSGDRRDRITMLAALNKGFEQWGEVFGDDVMAAALIDWVLHHYHLVNICGNSYRMREHTQLYRALQSDVEDSAEAVRSPRRSRPTSGSRGCVMCALSKCQICAVLDRR